MVNYEEQLKFEFWLESKGMLSALRSAIDMGMKHFFVDFRIISRIDPDFADRIINNFTEYFNYFKRAYGIPIRFTNLPSYLEKDIWKLRAEDIGKLVTVKGYIRTVTDVLHYVSSIELTCKKCNTVTKANPSTKKCPDCGSSDVIVTDKEISDIQKVIIEEDLKVISPSQTPRRVVVHMTDDLCEASIDKTLNPSKVIKVSGIVSEEKVSRSSNEYKKIILAHSIELVNESFDVKQFSEEDISKFREVANSKTFFSDMTNSIFPSIYGNEDIKKALLLQLVGGSNVYKDNKLSERGNIHILLVGNPGTAKSVMLKRMVNFLPNARFVSAISSSGVGLVASVSYSKELNSWILEAGALPRSSGSILMIDEIDKANPEDIAKLNNALVDLEVTIDKANIHAVIKCDTSLLAAANPKNRIFDNFEPVWKQIKLPKDFLDRFDLIFPVDNITNESEQKNVASRIFSKYKTKQNPYQVYSEDFIRKYLLYARSLEAPEITDEVEEYITNRFVKIMKPKDEPLAYFSSRLLTNIIRLTQAAAKSRLKTVATIDDANIAINLLLESLKKQDILVDEGVNIGKLEAVLPKAKREKKFYMKKIIKDGYDKVIGGINAYNAIEAYKEMFNATDVEAEEMLNILKHEGEVYEPKRGVLKVID